MRFGSTLGTKFADQLHSILSGKRVHGRNVARARAKLAARLDREPSGGEGQTKCFTHHLGGGGRSEELTPPRLGTHVAEGFGGLFQKYLPMAVSNSN